MRTREEIEAVVLTGTSPIALELELLLDIRDELVALRAKPELQRGEDFDELAWGLIANAWQSVENTGGQIAKEWVPAAERWREGYHGRLGLPRENSPPAGCAHKWEQKDLGVLCFHCGEFLTDPCGRAERV